jgi:hypothetical protein
MYFKNISVFFFVCFQRQRGFSNLTGVDYVLGAIDLAKGVLAKEGYNDVRLEVVTVLLTVSIFYPSVCTKILGI